MRIAKEKADEFYNRRKIAIRIEDRRVREETLRAITREEDEHLGSDEAIEGVRVPYGSSTNTARNTD